MIRSFSSVNMIPFFSSAHSFLVDGDRFAPFISVVLLLGGGGRGGGNSNIGRKVIVCTDGQWLFVQEGGQN